ncbi:MAG TPA: DUF4384 domain-containing protein [Pirellulales bacterium]|jgi:hypothetical protein|nr:DUF4384 domain-containing protein [Pirellulales bacterium]
MNTLSFVRRATVPILCVAAGLIGVGVRSASAEPTYRDLVRKYAQASPEQIPGVAPGQDVIALEYTVLLRDRNGNESPVDAATHQFNLGDQVRVQITPLNTVYIYIFHEGASGQQVCLLPEGTEQAPIAQAASMLTLPSDGFFEFSPPTGDEKLIVVATKQPSADLTSLQSAVFKKPGEQLSAAEAQEKARLEAIGEKTLKSMRDKAVKTTRYRDLLSGSTFRDLADEAAKQHSSVTAVERPHGSETSTLALTAGKDIGPLEMYVTIPLKSVSPKAQ